jgi:uncharacterized phage protein (TIGR01671 family)
MREIKFRAWDNKTNKMLFTGFHVLGEVTAFGLIEGHCLKTKGKKSSIERWNDIVLMQYTGLRDKNNKEIYEGDILQLEARDYGDEINRWQGVIEFGNPNGEYDWGFQLKPLHNANVNPEILLWVETELPNVSCEIIGNIYENPELVGGSR